MMSRALLAPGVSRGLMCVSGWGGRGFAAAAAAAGDEAQDLVVIGGGPGGYVAAIKAAQLGMKVTCVEKRGTLGGTCLNVGCIPSKALLHSSHMYHEAKHSFAAHGVKMDNLQIDVAAMMAGKDKSVKGLTTGIEGLFKKNGVTYVKGWGKVTKPGEVHVDLNDGAGTATLATKNILIATGSDVAKLPGVEVDEKTIVSSTGALTLSKVPGEMVVIGGGYIGLEMGSVWSRLGAKVTVVEFLDRIVPTMDGEVRKSFQRSLSKQGFKFKLKTAVKSAEIQADGKVKLTMAPAEGGDVSEMVVDTVLVSTGRTPYTEGLGLAELGVEMDKRGVIQIKQDGSFETNVPGIYAIGDVVPGPMLAHKAEEEGIACVERMATGHGHINYGVIPSICYTHPEVASVGMTEEECIAKGHTIKKGSFPFMANSRARTNDDAEGMVKFITDAETDKILGAHIMGPSAGEMIHEAALAMEYGASAEDIARTCHGHPTLSEAVKEAAMAAYSKPIHF